MEEAFELVNYEQGDGLEWEASDLAYHMLTFMALHGVTPQDILSNLASRTK
jgi:phosphoribosyl-ATP pyrophosphohydrolase